ncbi:hypothetical protein A0H81_09054 [Grifola frondosa]|uniref:Uncharacterized protein n=1 Tax=Grifola frondosa TaxID=5627 RepID=A0A1C7M0Y6_GRIFR|nr:hypothetical protein A0H81_09054 [Grifola frondosa]
MSALEFKRRETQFDVLFLGAGVVTISASKSILGLRW